MAQKEAQWKKDAFYLVTARSDGMSQGYASESASLWRQDGQLMATCEQLIALLSPRPRG